MAYVFRLEALLKVRLRLKEEAETRLGRAIIAKKNAEDNLYTARRRISETRKELAAKIVAGVLAHEYQWIQEQVSMLEKELEKFVHQVEVSEKAVEYARQELEARHRDVELVENFKTKDYQAYIKEMMRKEQVEAEDMASVRFFQGRRDVK